MDPHESSRDQSSRFQQGDGDGFREPAQKEWRYHLELVVKSKDPSTITQAVDAFACTLRNLNPEESAYLGRELIERFRNGQLAHCTLEQRSRLSMLIGFGVYESEPLRTLLLSPSAQLINSGLEWGALSNGLTGKLYTARERGTAGCLELITLGLMHGEPQNVERLSLTLLNLAASVDMTEYLKANHRFVFALETYIEQTEPATTASSRLLLKAILGHITMRDAIALLWRQAGISNSPPPINHEDVAVHNYITQHGLSVQQTFQEALEGTRVLLVTDEWDPESSTRIAEELRQVCIRNEITHILVAGLPIGVEWKRGAVVTASPCGSPFKDFMHESEEMADATREFYDLLENEVAIVGIDAGSSIYNEYSGELQLDRRENAVKGYLHDPSHKVLIFTSIDDLAHASRIPCLRDRLISSLPRRVAAVYSEKIGNYAWYDKRDATAYFHRYPREQSVGLRTKGSPIAYWMIDQVELSYGAIADYVIFRGRRDDGEMEGVEAQDPHDLLVKPSMR